MPPVRWRLLLMAMASVWVTFADSSKLDSISMTEDGWRPIVGSRREPTFNDEITLYRNPAAKKSEPVKAEKLIKTPPPSTTARSTSVNPKSASKTPLHTKPIILLPPHGAHGPQIPLGPMMHRPIKYGHIVKMHPHKRHKPVRMQMPSYSSRDEIFVPAPSSNIGPYAFFAPNQLKTRITHPHAHLDFGHHYPAPDDYYQVIRAPVQQYVLPPKHPMQNDVHYPQFQSDEFTRNLVPPPYKFVQQEKEKPKVTKPEPEPTKPYSTPFNQKDVDVEVTKEKFKVFRNTVPPQHINLQEEFEYHTLKTPQPPKLVTYDVTEGKHWQDSPPYAYHVSTRSPPKSRRPSNSFVADDTRPFLPTPLKPDVAPPTVPTDSEVSTIYNQVAQINRQKELATARPTTFDIKEVSTHYPVFGLPGYQDYSSKEEEEVNEVTTKSTPVVTYFYETTPIEIVPTTTTPKPTSTRPQRKRLNQRRRRPTTPKLPSTEEPEVVTEPYDVQKTESSSEEIVERPQRGRRPSRYRTTTSQPEEEVTFRTRQRRPRPSTEEPVEEVPSNHKLTYSEPTADTLVTLVEEKTPVRTTTEKDFPASFESHFSGLHKNQESGEEYEAPLRSYMKPYDGQEYEAPNRYYNSPPSREEKRPEEETSTRTNSYFTPENEVDYTTQPYVYTTTTTTVAPTETTTPTTTTTTAATTTTSTTTTTETPTTTKSHRVRARPVKYDNSNRPRFSVKEYRQRLSSSTSTTTTEAPKAATYSDSMRNRFPHRSRRPITTIGHSETVEESTEPVRSKFVPKDPRYGNPDADKSSKPVNPRLRPFGRNKSTTDATTTSSTPRISIKPNIFTNLRRPTPISLKTRILNKQRGTTEKPTTTSSDDSAEETNETDMSEIVESTVPYNPESTTEFGGRVDATPKKEDPDALKSDDFMQSQIVSELTSSARNEYDKPGVFKNVSPTSRKVPSYFTLATDDPILPIEAFFPNLKQ